MGRLLLALCLCAGPMLTSVAVAAEEAADVDPVALAALLIRDGHWDRAATALSDVDLSVEGVDRGRYHTLLGMIALHESRFADAVTAFEDALAVGPAEPMLYLQLAQARLGSEDFDGALAAVDQAGSLEDTVAAVWLLRSRSHWGAKRYDEGYAALLEGIRRFPERGDLAQHQVLLLVELGLFREAVEVGRVYLAGDDVEAPAYVLLAEAMRQAGEHREAIELLEAARLRFPAHQDVLIQLAGTWLAHGVPSAAGVVLQEAAEIDPKFALEAAECFRQAGEIDRALYMNGLVVDAEAKVRQRLGLLIESERFEQALALEMRLIRHGMAEDSGVAYALAYARFMTGDRSGAETWLTRITDTKIFEAATQLRTVMAACEEEPWTCR
ncbi:MAG: tetratricopeptide repeat protein [Proteobacteria bacterium]|nr:tetratricopeptide repeat protein [Pseudomonadota bacterium]